MFRLVYNSPVNKRDKSNNSHMKILAEIDTTSNDRYTHHQSHTLYCQHPLQQGQQVYEPCNVNRSVSTTNNLVTFNQVTW